MKKRIFVAVDLSEEIQLKVAQYIEELRQAFSNLKVGWERKEKLHLTLKFLGEIELKKVKWLEKVVSDVARDFTPFTIEISGTGFFGSKSYPRVLWLGVSDNSGCLERLQKILDLECQKVGFKSENRDFKAHLTIGRIRQPELASELLQEHLRRGFLGGEFQVSEVVIYESQLLREGSRYSIVSKHKLNQSF
ncbi:MAG: RNA 2',3'-cyclic phosphodiesterase [Pyrinomonadaceae bacterium]|nr:RNA 2',3'-cyclic phosphodiesterase [Pyrinomonadaceae bacterium]MCX7640447.1 RNA 2',3'-cyclic phosphodiesterase [Pyrinomonadaceae bacterium]MDW8304874.1 RNA 2',3'-cyclic phosphodiesterase [Acidobacteriota bacterium]